MAAGARWEDPMANRSERLNRLVIGFKCSTTWEQMKGDGARRFCAECRCEVLDFAQLLPAEIHAHTQARGGKLGARLTRRRGQLVRAREPDEPFAPVTIGPPRRFPAIAAGLVTAWLGAGAGSDAAQTGEPAAEAAAVAAAG